MQSRLTRTRAVVLAAASAVAVLARPVHAQEDGVVTVDTSVTHQTIVGWEVVDQTALYDTPYQIANHEAWRQTVIDAAIDDLGVNRIRIDLFSGYENPVDYFSGYIAGTVDRATWKAHWEDIVNDDSDPLTIDAAGFQFSELDYKINKVVQPLRARAAARGEQLYVDLCYVDFRNASSLHAADPDEYAEYVLAQFLHMDATFGFVPDGVEVILEPDLAASWQSPTRVADALVAAGDLLAAHGYTPDFIAPSNTDAGAAVSYFDTMIARADVAGYLTDLSYHRYRNSGASVIASIGQRSVQHGVRTAMLEWWRDTNSYKILHEDLKLGNVSSWQGGPLAYTNAGDSTSAYSVDISDPDAPVVALTHFAKYVRQYYRFVRRGAVRVGASSTSGRFDPLAFVNADGRQVVVVKAGRAGSFRLDGLRAGTYGIKYTTGDGRSAPTAYDVDLPDQQIAAGESIIAAIPDAGVITVHEREGPEITTGAVLPAATTTRTASWGFTAIKGRPPYSWSVTGGTPPVSAPIDGTTGVLSGTAGAPGTYVFTVTVTDAGAASDARQFTVVVNDLLRIPAGLHLVRYPAGVAPMSASQVLQASGARFVSQWSGGALTTRLATGIGADFTLQPGAAYLFDSAAAVEVPLQGGGEPAAQTVRLDVGIRFVGVPANLPAPRTASEIVAQIAADGGVVRALHRWEHGEFVPYLAGRTANDFVVAPGDAIVVDCLQACDWTPR